MYCDLKRIVTESFEVTDMTAATGAVLFHSENKGGGFHASDIITKNKIIFQVKSSMGLFKVGVVCLIIHKLS